MIVNKPKKKKNRSRFFVFNVIMVIVFVILSSKLLFLQVYKNDFYEERADIASTRFISEQAPRGKILDSEGAVLATNKQTYTLTYTKTPTAEKNFYSTMETMFKILNDNNEKYVDDLLLKIDDNGKFYFDFKTSNIETQKAIEIRFKKDRGFDEDIKLKDYADKKGDYTDEELKDINDKILSITPEETFYGLVKLYNMYELILPAPSDNATKEELNAYEEQVKKYKKMSGEEITKLLLEKYPLETIRRYMCIKDTIRIQGIKGNRSATIASNISWDTASIFYQKLNDLPGIDVKLAPVRYYPYNDLGSSVLGYVSSINSANAEQYELRGYDVSTDLIGMAGIESAFEEQLRGKKGGATVKVNSTGRVTETLFELETYPGNNVHLTIDKDIQYAAQQSLQDTLLKLQAGSPGRAPQKNATRGAVVAVEVKTGRVLALASYPDFDPNLFAIPGTLSNEESRTYFSPDLDEFGNEFIKRMGLQSKQTIDTLFPVQNGTRVDRYDLYPKPFYNYATQGVMQPGSTFKPLTSLVGLKEGIVTPSSIIVDRGAYREHSLGNFAPECMIYTLTKGTHGAVDLRKALQVSCNYYYYDIGYKLYLKNGSNAEALDTIAKYAWQFGLGYDPNSKEKAGTGIEIYENVGQAYNFQSFKANVVALSMFDLVSQIEKGEYRTEKESITFIPFDFEKNEYDIDEVKEAKERIKKVVRDTLNLAGTPIDKDSKFKEVYNSIIPDIKIIMNKSDKYKKKVEEYKASTGKEVNLDSEAARIATAIARFTIYDKFSEIASPAQLIYASIGQSTHAFTPLQMVQYTATLANGGTRYKLRLVDKITSPTGEVIQQYDSEVLNKIDISKEHLDAIKDGMVLVNRGNAFAGYPIPTAGKTGTADVSTIQNDIGRDPYATYISFAPVDDPEIAVFSVLYDAGKGSYAVDPVKAVYDAYFKDRILQIDPNYGSKSESFRKYVLESPVKEDKDTSTNQQSVTEENPAIKPEENNQ